MALTQKQRDERRREKEAKLGAEELRIKALSGERQMVREIMAWTEDSEQASVIMACIRHMHSLGKDGARAALKSLNALHKIDLKDSWSARFDNESRKELMRDPGDQIICPAYVKDPC